MSNEGDRVAALLDGALGSAAATALESVDALASIRSIEAAIALRRVGDESHLGSVRKAARRGLHKLVTLGFVPPEREVVQEDHRPGEWQIYRALSSFVDGFGGRMLWIALVQPGELAALAMLVSEEKGITELSVSNASKSAYDRQAADMLGEEESPWVEIPADYARRLVEEGHAANLASRTKLPLDYLAWRERIGKPHVPQEQPAIYSVVNSAEVRWDPQFLDGSGELMQLREFQIWILDSSELMEFVRERAIVQQSGLVIAGARPEERRGMATDHAIQKLFDSRRRAIFKRRLEEMAFMLWQQNRSYQAKMALAAALAMEPPDRSLESNPFIRALIDWNLDVTEQLESENRTRSVKPGVSIELPY